MKERFWLKPVAILLGILSWFYVNIHSGTPIVRDYKVKIVYLNKDDSKNYKVIPESPEVKIKVKGPRNTFIATKVEENTFASVDLINCHGGKLTLPVNVLFPPTSNLQVVAKEPAQLVINAIKMHTKKIKVNVNVIGSVPDGYLSGEPSVSPEYLSVTAPIDVIDTIKECRIDLYLDDVKRSLSEYRQAHIIYQDGIIESDLKGKLISIDNNNIKLDLAVREGYPEKTISVKAELINKPPEGKKLDSCIVKPDKVTISGSAKLLENINDISLEQVDLSKIQKSSEVLGKIKLPKGINLVGNNNIMVNIGYSDILVTKEMSNLPLEVTHDEEQLVEYDVTTYTIQLEGYIDDINSINKNELKNIIRVKGLASGTHLLPLEIPYGFSKRVKVKSIIPESVQITVRLLEKVQYDEEEKLPPVLNSTNEISSETMAIIETNNSLNEQTDNLLDKKLDNNSETINNVPKIVSSSTSDIADKK